MPRKIVLTTAEEAEFRRMWDAGLPVDRICERFDLTHDAVNRVRARMGMPPRTPRTRAERREPTRDPSPEEIAALCAELRAKHMAKRLAEPATRKYRTDTEVGGRVYPCDVFDIDG